ncbi:hypothetical protein GWI33_010793, partial [Rhynchophorus ferrugineus]
VTQLPVLTITASDDTIVQDGFVSTHANSVLKSDAPLFETAQSVTVVTRDQLDYKQANTLSEALQGIAGVVSSPRGRRGWDDFIIRGQVASDSVFVDGLRQNQNHWVSIESFGYEQVQVLKGPASVNFGNVLPGGLVNLVTKRPQKDPFANIGVVYGSHDLKQATLDIGQPIDGIFAGAAWRFNAKISDSDDATDHVYFKRGCAEPETAVKPYRVELREDVDEIWATECFFTQPLAAPSSPQPQETEYVYRVISPLNAVLYKVNTAAEGVIPADVICLFIQPFSETHIRAHLLMILDDQSSSMTDMVLFQQQIFTQDKPRGCSRLAGVLIYGNEVNPM